MGNSKSRTTTTTSVPSKPPSPPVVVPSFGHYYPATSRTSLSFSSNYVPPTTSQNVTNTSVTFSNLAFKQTTSLPKSTPITAVAPFVVFDANNYIIPKYASSNNSILEPIPLISVPCTAKVDRFSMKVCNRYNSKKSCSSQYCYRLHVCIFWVISDCTKEDCSFDHNFNSARNSRLVQPFMRRNFSQMHFKESLKKNVFHGKSRNSNICDHICVDYVLKRCKRNPCNAIHADYCFVWEIYVTGKWIKLTKKQNEAIEASYCDPQNSSMVLEPLRPRQGRRYVSLLDKIFLNKNYTVNFENMSVSSQSSYYRLRRLSTPSDVSVTKDVATRWLWFWEETNKHWPYFTSGMQKDFFIIPLSDHLESHFVRKSRNIEFKIGNYNYTVDFENMTQTNCSTLKVRRLRRRPLNSIDVYWRDGTTYYDLWAKIPSDTFFVRISVTEVSPEFSFVENMLKTTLPSIAQVKIERIQNVRLWQAYQLRKIQMLNSYNGNAKMLNEQFLFHGTSPDVIDKICSDNFDWRLFGTSTGNVYGQGTYFSNEALLSNSYASQDDQGNRYMFVALVLIGTTAIGNSSMNFPPVNKLADKRFDTTVNSHQPKIFVKYDMDVYYPAYLVKYKV